MNRIFAISGRILSQFAHDRRTLALLFVAPIIVLWLLSVLLGASTYISTVAAVDLPGEYREVLESQDVHIKDMDRDKAEKLLRDDELDAVLYMEDEGAVLHVYSEGSNMSEKKQSPVWFQSLLMSCLSRRKKICRRVWGRLFLLLTGLTLCSR